MAVLRSVPEDFVVDEVPLYPASGAGAHTFLRVEKRLRDTQEVARALARFAGVPVRDVGYAGRKDRVALARQWFSVPGLAPERALAFEDEGVRVLEARRHAHKLRTGQLLGNRFELILRDASPALRERGAGVLAEFGRSGLPNRFGAQRFGRGGRNPELGLSVLTGGAAPRDRRHARFLVSALQAAVFNEVLVRRGPDLARLETGDVAVVHASGGLFRVDDPEHEAPRARGFEISATGPIFGTRVLAPAGVPAERERRALAAFGVEPRMLAPPPPGIPLRGSRRSLRVRPRDARAEPRGDALHLIFLLPRGAYASVLAEELSARCGGEPLTDAASGTVLSSATRGGPPP